MTGCAGHPYSPAVSVVVLNFNGRDYLPACLKSLMNTEYPEDKIDITVVDNASSDGSLELVRQDFPEVNVFASGANLGFAVGNNIGIRKAVGEFVALINPDTEVTPGWLRPLVETMKSSPNIAAVCPKLLLYEDRLAIHLHSATFIPEELGLGRDNRSLGLRVYSVRSSTKEGEVFGVEFRRGFGGVEVDEGGREFRWTNGSGEIGIFGGGEGTVLIELSAPRPDLATVPFAVDLVSEQVGEGAASSDLITVPVQLPGSVWASARPVVQNAGSELLPDGSSRDRGTLMTGGSPYADWDGKQYEVPVDVFSLCGAGVLLRRGPLLEVGGLDEKIFMYYEDTDLAYRLRRRGWGIRFEPDSIIRHHHAALADEWSPFFLEQVTRNRLYVLLKHRSYTMFGRAVIYELQNISRLVFGLTRGLLLAQDCVRPILSQLIPRLRALVWVLWTIPYLLVSRNQENQTAVLRDIDLAEWVVDS